MKNFTKMTDGIGFRPFSKEGKSFPGGTRQADLAGLILVEPFIHLFIQSFFYSLFIYSSGFYGVPGPVGTDEKVADVRL